MMGVYLHLVRDYITFTKIDLASSLGGFPCNLPGPEHDAAMKFDDFSVFQKLDSKGFDLFN